ncbi:MAG: AAA family ATPase [Bacteroidetes bacterium]|jgi:exodeoxyribonuclease V|nr:AAA family ATPase [Bacteroidota bacterium]MBT6687015.1 AAA family ATPase [Bacteroidota bacterium]MBT7144991.1 AAA family ATPase [Bacteroidota bacterium]MBT7490103.1 AAA family ATPase [Bacteroidota bacterium]
MIKNFISEILLEMLGFEPTNSQWRLISKLSGYIKSNYSRQMFLIFGYAGTGKTTMISSLVKSLKKLNSKFVLLAPTGRAAKVLSSYCESSAYTIHKKIYRQKSTKDIFSEFVLDRNLHKNTYFIVDEVSMISNATTEQNLFGTGRLLEDLIDYVFEGKNCKLLFIGDTAQLPPIGLEISPAMDHQILESLNLNVEFEILTDVVRQSLESGILYNATKLRKSISDFNDISFDNLIKFETQNFEDIFRLNGNDLIEEISNSYDIAGIEETIIVCRTNKRANRYNQGIRKTILWREDEISAGDLLMIVKNNYFWTEENEFMDFIANGDIVEVMRIEKYEELYGFRFAHVCLRFVDYDNVEIDTIILLDTLSAETASLSSEDSKKLFMTIAEDFQDIRSRKKKYQKVIDNQYFNALQVKFAYAVTCHKSQGGQWKNVFVDQGYIIDNMINIEYLRWLYTAITRSTEKLYLVNFADKFYEKELW